MGPTVDVSVRPREAAVAAPGGPRTRPAGPPPDSAARYFLYSAVFWLIVPMFAGYLPVLFDRRRRGLPDYLASTEVVYERRARRETG